MGATTAKKRSIKNLTWGIACQIIAIAFGIVVPRLVLVSYGSEINGLLNSVVQIFSYFVLFEAGIGAVALQALYKSVGENNQNVTNSILSAVHKYYRRIGVLYALAVIALSIIYPLVVESTIPWLTVVLVIIFNGISPVANFLFQGKYALLLQAEGKIYILNAINTTINILTSIAKISMLTTGFDVVAVQFSVAMVSLLQMIYITWYVRTHYQWIDLKVAPYIKALSQSKNALVHQITGLVCSSTNVVLLTLFAGLKAVSVYAMYMLLFGMVRTFLVTANNSFLFVLGQRYNTNRQDFLRIERMYETIYLGAIFVFYTIAAIFITPFLRLYTAGVDDVNYEMEYLPTLFLIINVLSYARTPGIQIIGFAAHFRQTQTRAIIEASINFIIALTLVHSLGIYGVLLGTLAALSYRTNDTLLYVAHHILHISAKPIYCKFIVFALLSATMMFLSSCWTQELLSYASIIFHAALYCTATLVIFAGIALAVDREIVTTIGHTLQRKNRQKANNA